MHVSTPLFRNYFLHIIRHHKIHYFNNFIQFYKKILEISPMFGSFVRVLVDISPKMQKYLFLVGLHAEL